MKSRKRAKLLGLGVVALALGVGAWNSLLRTEPVVYADEAENFK